LEIAAPAAAAGAVGVGAGLATTQATGSSIDVKQEGKTLGEVKALDVRGAGVAVRKEGDSAVVDIPAGRAGVTNELLWWTDSRIGVEVNKKGLDQGARLQAAFDLALTGDGVLHMTPGWVEVHNGRKLKYSRQAKTLFLVGAGAGVDSGTVIKWTDDGKGRCIVPSDEGSYPISWRDFLLWGPDVRSDMGQKPADMGGPLVVGRSSWVRVNVRGFADAYLITRDHHEFHSCILQGNGYGNHLAENEGQGGGDFWFFGCYFDGSKLASHAIGTTHQLANFTFVQGHSGSTPIGIYRYEEGAKQRHIPFLLGGDFINHPFEACGDAVIYDEPGDGWITNVRFSETGGAVGGRHWKPQPRGMWQLGGVERISVTGDVSPWVYDGTNKPWIHANEAISNLHVADASYALENIVDVKGARLLQAPRIAGVSLGSPGPGALRATSLVAEEPVKQWDVLEVVGDATDDLVRPARNAAPTAGIAAHDAGKDEVVFVVSAGSGADHVRARNGASSKIPRGAPIGVDSARPGSVKALPAFSPQAIGRAIADIAPGAPGPVKLQTQT
jgi:hypothetical protein